MEATSQSPLRQSIQSNAALNANDELDMVEVIAALLRRKWIIVLSSLIAGAIAFGLTKLMPNQYEAYVRTNLNQPEDPGGVSPDNRRAPEVLTLVEHGFVLGSSSDNYRDVIMAKLRSRDFTTRFIDKHNLAPRLFPDLWDQNRQTWVSKKPDARATYMLFHEKIRFVDHNQETDLISIRIRFNDPDIAASWANDYVADFNEYMRNSALEDVEKKQSYLNKKLLETDVVELHKSIYRLIEAQTAIAMLASSTEEYALQVLDAAYPPIERFSPARKRITIMGAAGGFGLAFFLVILSIPVRRIRESLREYRVSNPD